ncbi:MAG: hypothetical protein IT271_12340 [Chitinophagales bacterium]|nr:hypothetical protein [Chitinophagales bacterium]
MKKQKVDTRINVQVIKAYRSDKGTVKYIERFVKVEDVNQAEKIDISR